MNTIIRLYFPFIFSILTGPAKSCLQGTDLFAATGSLYMCTEQCTSMGCDIPNCKHDCHCTFSSITGQGCDMSSCEYNCFDDVGVGTDMRNCKYNCQCSRGPCDMRSCNPKNTLSTEYNRTDGRRNSSNNTTIDLNCFCAGGNCGAIGQVGMMLSVFICFGFVFIGSFILFMYCRQNKKAMHSIAKENAIAIKSNDNLPQNSLPSVV